MKTRIVPIEDGALVVRLLRATRAGWADAFAEMARRGDDEHVDGPTPSSFDEGEWQWR